MQDSSAFQFLAIDTIHESTTNPRQTFEPSKLEELAESIRQHGLIQPITVRPNANGFEIVAGARRFRAAQLAELFSLPARIVELTDAQAMEWQLVELSIGVKLFLWIHAAPHVVVMSTTCGGRKWKEPQRVCRKLFRAVASARDYSPQGCGCEAATWTRSAHARSAGDETRSGQ